MELHSDQNKNIESQLFQEICDILGIRKTITTSLHLQSDGMSERFYKTLESHLLMFISEHQDGWNWGSPVPTLGHGGIRSALHEIYLSYSRKHHICKKS